MNTLILYATKHGATAEIARRIADKLGGATLHNLADGGVPNLADYDAVIIGSAVYAGMLRKEAKVLLSAHADALQQKRLGLFASGLLPAEEQKIFADNVPPQLLAHASSAMLLGGVFDPTKANFAERMVMKVVAKHSGVVNTIDGDKIVAFVQAVTS